MKVQIQIFTEINKAPIEKLYEVDRYYQAIEMAYEFVDKEKIEYQMIQGNTIEEAN